MEFDDKALWFRKAIANYESEARNDLTCAGCRYSTVNYHQIKSSTTCNKLECRVASGGQCNFFSAVGEK